MNDLISTLNRMIDNQEKFYNEITRRIEEQNKSLVEIDKRLENIIGAVK